MLKTAAPNPHAATPSATSSATSSAASSTPPDSPVPVDPRKGTQTLPMPDQSEEVAGMPRDGRAIARPGEPGVIAPEDDVLDTTQENRKG